MVGDAGLACVAEGTDFLAEGDVVLTLVFTVLAPRVLTARLASCFGCVDFLAAFFLPAAFLVAAFFALAGLASV